MLYNTPTIKVNFQQIKTNAIKKFIILIIPIQ